MLIFFVIIFFFKFILKNLRRLLQRLGIFKTLKYFNDNWEFNCGIHEDCGEYWQCLSGLAQKNWYTREAYIRDHFHIKTLQDNSMQELCCAQRGKDLISSICSYNILDNTLYQGEFQYTPFYRREHHFQSLTSDLILKVLLLGEE